jgi:hypothetical protein
MMEIIMGGGGQAPVPHVFSSISTKIRMEIIGGKYSQKLEKIIPYVLLNTISLKNNTIILMLAGNSSLLKCSLPAFGGV